MVLAAVVGVKTVKGRTLAQLSTVPLGRAARIDFEGRNPETTGLLLFLALHDDKVLDKALTKHATTAGSTAALLATQEAWHIIHQATSFPAHLERHGDYLVMVSEDRKVRVGVTIPAGVGFRVVRVTFASPITFETSIIMSTHTLAIAEGEVRKHREVLCGGEFWQVIFEVLATVPNGADHLHRLLTRAIATYGSLRYDVVRPPPDMVFHLVGGLPLAPFASMLGGPPESSSDSLHKAPCSAGEPALRATLDAAVSRIRQLEAQASGLQAERAWLLARVASLEAGLERPQRRASLPSSLPPATPIRASYRPRAALLGAVRPLPARPTPPRAPGPDIEQHASSTPSTPGAITWNQINMMSPDSRAEFERRCASPLLMSSYPSPAHSSPFVPESPPYDPTLPPHPLFVSPSSFPSTRLVFDAMTPPQPERRPSPPPTEDDAELADRALNMSVDEIEDDDDNEAVDA